ncbi:MAG: 30S ribosomal protein S8 [Candidatus Magasanikbacteria bacterium RIFOXYC2_FULL_42_28]|uniref:Small ribosomal subunit protein uS8 n=1 Tax=Candidatus Magasanikbacteria bacterium RIFOXYC2_FULL_42_28 TaxID=1798704 RepID=A0A1F6NUE7_9BACT|nr:MAG: 30S ribosomal protein S8 [Candidatus Magasanikbacteria bacterium RIFOXYC2_FULL_42_28]
MMTDPIADMLTRIRNAYSVKAKEVEVSHSKVKKSIADILVREGYITGVEERREKHSFLVLNLKYNNGQPALHSIKRVSRPSSRRYVGKDDIGQVLNGYGFLIVTTPKGIMTGSEARKAGVGGEVICEIY